jgi:hypothetical protein
MSAASSAALLLPGAGLGFRSAAAPQAPVVSSARVFYGGVGAKLFRANQVERALVGQPLNQVRVSSWWLSPCILPPRAPPLPPPAAV